MARVLLGVFDERSYAQDAISEFKSFGLNPKDISIMMKDISQAEDMASDTGTNIAGGVISGATTGGILGGIAGLLVGIGAVTIPGMGAILIGGPLAAALGLTGAAATAVSGAATGALAGGIVGALIGLGVPEEDAREYEERIKAGAILLAVPSPEDKEEEVRAIFEEHGATQIRSINADWQGGQIHRHPRREESGQHQPPSFLSEIRRKIRGR